MTFYRMLQKKKFVNKSDKPLKLDNVAASCGCTTPEWSREEIAPGATAVIKVGYNAAAEGPFEKPITITYVCSETTVIKIKGEVWKAPAGTQSEHPLQQLPGSLQLLC